MDPTIGPLVPADETFWHQITDTFATVSESDRSWTEKVCAMAAARDGSLQVAFGMGRYANRGVLDAYAGVSRGAEQWTVRASRAVAATDAATAAGPIRYEVLEPLRSVRWVLEPNPVVPIAFDCRFEGVVPPALEAREVHRRGARVDADVVRYHHVGVASGWVEVDGERREIAPESWVATRDHSWGVRYQVGAPATDVAAAPTPPGLASLVCWCPILFERPDGSRYAFHVYTQRHALGGWERVELQGGFEYPDGRREAVAGLVPELRFRDDNRRFLGGRLTLTMGDGTARPLDLAPVSDTGFHLGTGLYHGFDGHWHGEYRGAEHLDGEHFADCSDPAVARRVHQHRDCVVRAEDPVGGGVGWGNLQSIVTGAHPALGLSEEASFL